MKTESAPNFIEGEKAILGGLLIDSSRAPKVFEELDVNDFYLETHRFIFAAMVAIVSRDLPLDWLTLTRELRKTGKLEAAGGIAALTDLAEAVPSAANIMHYVRVVKERAVLRDLLAATSEIQSLCYSESADFEGVIRETEELALRAASVRAGREDSGQGELRPFSKSLSKALDMASDSFSRGNSAGILSGFGELDSHTTGFNSGELIVICGRPSAGKTAFAWACARAAAEHVAVGFFSLEMTEEHIAQRGLAREGALNLRNLRTGDFGQDVLNRLVTAMGDLSELPVYINAPSTLSPAQVRFRVRSLALRSKIKIGLIIIDYLQLMNPGRRIESREQQIATISRELKQAAKELECPIILLSQLNREVEKRPDKRPKLSDLRESGAVEQDADVVIGLYQAFSYTGRDEDRGKAEAIIMKSRNGPVGTVELRWVPETASFWDLDQGGSAKL